VVVAKLRPPDSPLSIHSVMKKNQNSSSGQQNLIKPAVVFDWIKLLTESKLSDNDKGIIKRRLIESRAAWEKVLQRLVNRAQQETSAVDIPESLRKLEEKEGKEIRSFDSIAKVLSREFPGIAPIHFR
jgi:formate dehydrogenase maturation protein FdhE